VVIVKGFILPAEKGEGGDYRGGRGSIVINLYIIRS